MSIWNSILFGLVEGLTEFVPVSSTAHMLLLQRVLAIPASADMFSYLVIIQLGAIVALLVYFWRDFWLLVTSLFARPFSTPPNRQAWFAGPGHHPGPAGGLPASGCRSGFVRRPLDGGRDSVPYGSRLADHRGAVWSSGIDRWSR